MIARFGISYERARDGALIIDDQCELERDKAERPAGRSTSSQPAVETHANSLEKSMVFTMNNGNGVNGDGVGSIGVAKVTTVHDPEYRVGDAAEAALLFNKSLLIIPGDGRYSGHWAVTKVNERSVAVTSQIDDENNFKETEGVEKTSVKFNLGRGYRRAGDERRVGG